MIEEFNERLSTIIENGEQAVAALKAKASASKNLKSSFDDCIAAVEETVSNEVKQLTEEFNAHIRSLAGPAMETEPESEET